MGTCRGMQFVDILRNRPEYRPRVKNAESCTSNQTRGDKPSIVTFKRYLSMGDVDPDTPEVEWEIESGDADN